MTKIQIGKYELEQIPGATFVVPAWIIYIVLGVIILLVAVIIYKKREDIIHFYNMARGRAVVERYLVYQGDEYDYENAPKNQRKNDRFINWEMGIVILSYPIALILLIFATFYGIIAILIVLFVVGSMEIWRRLMAYYEVKKYGPSLHLKLFYQDLDGQEGELFLDNTVVSDRLTIKPLDLVTQANAAEHVIRSGIDERRLTADTTREYLSEAAKTKLRELEKLAKDRDQSVLDAVSTMDFLRRYFDLEEDDPLEEIPEDIVNILDELKDMILKIEIPLDTDEEIRNKLPILKIYPGEKMIEKEKVKKKVKDGDKEIEVEEEVEKTIDPQTRLDPASVIWYWLSADGIEANLQDLELFREGFVTHKMKKTLKTLHEAAVAKDEKMIEILKNTDIIKRYFGISIPYWSGQADTIKRYRPHIYTFYPNKDLRRRCVIIFSVPYGEAIKKDSKIHVNFDYTGFAGIGGVIEAVRVGTVNEVLLEGAEVQGVRVDLPEDMFAVETDVPLFIASAFDYTDELARKGLRDTKPAAEIAMFVRVVKSLTDLKSVLSKYQKALREITRLKREDKEEKVKDDTDRAEQDLDMSPLIDPSRIQPRVEYEEVPYPIWKMALILILGMALGAILLLIVIKLLGWTIADTISGDWLLGFDSAEWVKRVTQARM